MDSVSAMKKPLIRLQIKTQEYVLAKKAITSLRMDVKHVTTLYLVARNAVSPKITLDYFCILSKVLALHSFCNAIDVSLPCM